MRGIPRKIQTPADLQNLFAMARSGALNRAEKALAVERCNELLATQYHSVPILSAEGASIIVRYFPECKQGDATAEGSTIKSVKHIEDRDSEDMGAQFSETHITLSRAPADKVVLSILMVDNFLTQNNFDVAEINFMRGGFTQ